MSNIIITDQQTKLTIIIIVINETHHSKSLLFPVDPRSRSLSFPHFANFFTSSPGQSPPPPPPQLTFL